MKNSSSLLDFGKNNFSFVRFLHLENSFIIIIYFQIMKSFFNIIDSNLTNKYKIFPSLTLLSVLVFLILVIPMLSFDIQNRVYFSVHLFLIVSTSLLLNKHRKIYFLFAILFVVTKVLIRIIFIQNSELVVNSVSILFMIWVSIAMINQVMAKKASIEIVLDAISGYLLVGVAFTFVNFHILQSIPDSFTYSGTVMLEEKTTLSLMSYYTFITYTSTGYGDLLPIGKVAMSVSKFIVITGQIYISIVIAIIIGKYMQVKGE